MTSKRPEPELLDLPPFRAHELATRWGVTDAVVTAACRSGRLIGAFQPGGKLWLIPRDAVERIENGEAA